MNPEIMRKYGMYETKPIQAKKVELFQIKLNMWVEVKVAETWVIGQIVDITRDGKKVWIETHEDTYTKERTSGEIRKMGV